MLIIPPPAHQLAVDMRLAMHALCEKRKPAAGCILQNRVGGIMAWIPHARLRNPSSCRCTYVRAMHTHGCLDSASSLSLTLTLSFSLARGGVPPQGRGSPKSQNIGIRSSHRTRILGPPTADKAVDPVLPPFSRISQSTGHVFSTDSHTSPAAGRSKTRTRVG